MYETNSNQSRRCMEFPHSSRWNREHRKLVIFGQEEPAEICVRQIVADKEDGMQDQIWTGFAQDLPS
jgi:hypothetical protein